MAAEDLRDTGERLGIAPLSRTAVTEGGINLQPATERLASEWGRREKEAPAGQNFLSNVVGLDSPIAGFHRMVEDAGYEHDPDFRIEDLDEKEWEFYTKGISPEAQMGLAGAASRAHLGALAVRLRSQAQAEEELAGYGGWGIAGRIGVNILDPVSLSAMFATGGIGAISKGERIVHAVRAARAASAIPEARAALAVLEAAAKVNPMSNAIRVGLVAGAENTVLAAAANYGVGERNGWDLVAAGGLGLFLGAGMTRVFNGRALAGLQRAYVAERRATNLLELDTRISTQRAELTARLASLDVDAGVEGAQDAIKALQRDLAQAATARRVELTDLAGRAPKDQELRRLSREHDKNVREGTRVDGLLPEVEARMLREDVESMGEAVALSKPRAKLRKAAAELEVRKQKTAATERTTRTGKSLLDGQSSLRARDELRKLERAEKQGKSGIDLLDEARATTFATRQVAAQDELAKALGIQAQKKAAVQTELDGLEQARAAGVEASERTLVTSGFGPDSLSAARFEGFNEGLHPHLTEPSGLPEVSKMSLAGAVRFGPVATISGILRGSDNALVRKLLGRMVGNSLGNADGSVNTVGASEIAKRLHEGLTAKANSALTPAYDDWTARNGYGPLGKQLRTTRDKFMADVGRHMRGQESQDPAVSKAAAGMAKVFKDYLTEAKAAGVKGFENVDPNASYLPRVFDFRRVHEIEEQIGSDALRRLVSSSIRAGNDDIDDALADKLAAAYVKRMKELRVGSDVGLMQGVSWDDVGFLRRFLGEAGTPSDEIEDVINKFAALNAQRSRQTEGSFRNAKHRVQFDENHAISFRDQNAAKAGRIEDVEVRMSALFENNVEALYGRYSRSMSGHIGMAKVGIKSRKDFDDSIALVERELNGDLRELQRVKQTADVAYKLITGQPIEDSSTLSRLGRAARDYNFSTTMGQAGFAQVPDFHGLLVSGYLGHTLKNFFGTLSTFRRVDGSIDDAFYREAEEMIGVGTDFHNNAVFSSYDPGEETVRGLTGTSKLAAVADNVMGRAEHGLRVAGRGVQAASGMAFMNSFAQRLAARAIVQRLVKEVTEGGAFSARRVATLGLDGPMKVRIEKQLRAHTEFVEGDFGGKVRVVNYAKWDDVDARDAMMTAVFRESRRIVQEEDFGDTSLWMHKGWGKIIVQFRRFALVGYTKQVLFGIAHHDAEAAVGAMMSMTLAAMAYKARHELRVASLELGGADEQKLAEYREKYLSNDRYAAAAWANSSYSSLTPALIDTTSSFAIGKSFFDTRSSGQGSDLITGNPTYSLLSSMKKAGSGAMQAALRGDRQFDESDAKAFRRLAPFQNIVGMDAMFQAMTDGLPEKDEDPDTAAVDWLAQN